MNWEQKYLKTHAKKSILLDIVTKIHTQFAYNICIRIKSCKVDCMLYMPNIMTMYTKLRHWHSNIVISLEEEEEEEKEEEEGVVL